MVLFPIDALRVAVETAKRILTKEKLDKQLAGHSSSTPFMNIKVIYNKKKVTFDTWDWLKDKIDRLTVMMGKLATEDYGISKQFKPQIYQSKRRGQSTNFMINVIMIEGIIKIGTDQIVEIEEFS